MKYGALLWFFNILILMPLLLETDTPVLIVHYAQWALLLGHLAYGATVAIFFNLFYWKKPRIRFIPPGMGD